MPNSVWRLAGFDPQDTGESVVVAPPPAPGAADPIALAQIAALMRAGDRDGGGKQSEGEKQGVGGKIGGILATIMGFKHAEDMLRKERAWEAWKRQQELSYQPGYQMSPEQRARMDRLGAIALGPKYASQYNAPVTQADIAPMSTQAPQPGGQQGGGGLFRELQGKHSKNLSADQDKAMFLLNTLFTVATDPKSQLPDTTVDWLVSQAGSVLGKDTGQRIKDHIEQVRAARQLEAARAALPQQNQIPVPGTAGTGPPGVAPPQPAPQPQQPLMQPRQGSFINPITGAPVPMQLPVPPFSGGAARPTGPAPNPPTPVVGVAQSGAFSNQGFGGAPTAPVQTTPATRWTISPVEAGANALAINQPLERFKTDEEIRKSGTIAQQVLAAQIAEQDRKIQLFRSSPDYKALNPRDRAFIEERIRGVEGAFPNVTRPLNLPSSSIPVEEAPAGALDLNGNPLDRTPGKWVRQQQDQVTGDIRYYYTAPKESIKVEPDNDSSTGHSYVARSPNGHVMYRSTAPIPGSQVVRETDTDMYLQVGDQVMRFPKRTITGPTGGGLPAPPGATTPAAATQRGAQSATTPRGTGTPATGVVVGNTPAYQRRLEQNELTQKGRDIMTELDSRRDMLQRLQKELEPYRNQDIPLGNLMDSILYRMGYAGDKGGFLAALQLSQLGQAASILQGVTKSQKMMAEAKIHTADAWKDSSKLMYQKLGEILLNMDHIEKAVYKYQRLFPNMPRDGEGGADKSGGKREPITILLPSGKKLEFK